MTARTDTDGVGIPDYLEVTYGSQPFDGDSPFAAGAGDEDSEGGPAGDSIPDGLEQFLAFLGAEAPVTEQSDSDGDGIPDVIELLAGMAPLSDSVLDPSLVFDTDGDGIADYVELLHGSNPDDADAPLVGGTDDTDDTTGPGVDAISDALESLLVSLNATAPITTQTDSDLDGIPDYVEYLLVTDPFDVNSPAADLSLIHI